MLKAKKSIQRSFIWAGQGGNQKVAWANWELVCQPKANGSLEVNEIGTIHSFHVLSHTEYGAMCIGRWLEISITLHNSGLQHYVQSFVEGEKTEEG